MTREDVPAEPEPLSKDEKAEAKEALEQDLAPVEASPDQEAQNQADKERMLIARADDAVPFPSPGSVRHKQQKGPLAGEPDPLTPRDHGEHTEERDPLVPAVAVEVVEAPTDARQVDEATGRVESEEERDERLEAAEKAAAARRRKRKAAAKEKAAADEKAK